MFDNLACDAPARVRADVAVIGCGPAGAATALKLAATGASVVSVQREGARPLLGESIPSAVTQSLNDLGVLGTFVAGSHLPAYGNRSTWGGAAAGEYESIRSPLGTGFHLDRTGFDGMWLAALENAGVSVIRSSRVRAVEWRDACWHLQLSGSAQRTVCAGFLVDASGRAATATRALNIKRRKYDRLVGVIGAYQTNEPAAVGAGITEVHAAQDGWWYTSPAPGGMLVVGYMTDVDLASPEGLGTECTWYARMEQTPAVHQRVERDGFRRAGSLRVVAAHSSEIETVAGARWCAVGDAAATYDPLSSQGIGSALQSGITAGRAISTWASGGQRAFEDWTAHSYALYRARWLAYYAEERRWPDSTFWGRRHEALQRLLVGGSGTAGAR